jgi:hypothetical protein
MTIGGIGPEDVGPPGAARGGSAPRPAECRPAFPLPRMQWSLTALEPHAMSVAGVRRQAREAIADWGADDLEWALSQLLTEVASNAVLHAGTPFDVCVSYDPASGSGRLRCEVTDASGRPPRRRRYSRDSATGRGLNLLDELAARWGVDLVSGGKTVWFELEVDTSEQSAPDLDVLLEGQPGGGRDHSRVADHGGPGPIQGCAGRRRAA